MINKAVNRADIAAATWDIRGQKNNKWIIYPFRNQLQTVLPVQKLNISQYIPVHLYLYFDILTRYK